MYFYLSFLFVITFWATISQCISTNDTATQNNIKALRKELFKDRGYDPMARPVLNYTHPTNVALALDLIYITGLDVRTNILSSEGWIRLMWEDENLKWVPSEFGGLDDIRVAVTEVFRPDITIINSVQTENIVRTNTHSDLLLWNNGQLVWLPALSMKTICEVDLTEWPFDRQNCQYRFSSWTYEGSALNLRNDSNEINIENLVENPEWAIHDTYCEYKLHNFGDEKYPEVIYHMTMDRKATIYRYTVYLPVLSALFLNLMTLFLKTENQLRFHLSSLSFITLLLVLLYLGNKLGFGSLGMPKVIRYIGQMIILVSVTLLWSAFALNFAKSAISVPPTVMRAIEPVQQWLVSNDAEAEQLANSVDSEGQMQKEEVLAKNRASNNVVFIQVVDKVLFVLFFILIIVLHN